MPRISQQTYGRKYVHGACLQMKEVLSSKLSTMQYENTLRIILQVSCKTLIATIERQIEAWSGEDLCLIGTESINEKCLYSLEYRNSTCIKATHTTPIHRFVDEMEMNFFAENGKSQK